MSRQILCRKCGDNHKQHKADAMDGLEYRKVWLSCTVPQGHGLIMNGVFTPIEDIHCDLCNEPITGEICHAVSQWRSEQGEMSDWEKDFGTVLTPETVRAMDLLTERKEAK